MSEKPRFADVSGSQMLARFGLTPEQHDAAAARGLDVAVTAGAGSGKTRTLVARYLSLLEEGCLPQRVVAITFTEKAAREMRSRVRSAMNEFVQSASISSQERLRWSELDVHMDSARIGTIHSLCAEILRAHPAEMGIDPRFEVIDEGLAAVLRAQVLDDTLSWLVEREEFLPLLADFTLGGLTTLLNLLLNQRLEAQAAFSRASKPDALLREALNSALNHPALEVPLRELREMHSAMTLEQDAGEKLARQIEGLLSAWGEAETYFSSDNLIETARQLFVARRSFMGGGAGKKGSVARDCLVELKEAYDSRINPWLGGKNAQDPPPDPAAEACFTRDLPLLRSAFDYLLEAYREGLRRRHALDFDDLEAGAAALLSRPELRRHWQDQVDALLVDEFQDTNARQREIVQALCGETPGRLFVVGDARQSIYRFRRADVTVFRSLQHDIARRGGRVIDLDETFRAHAPLLGTTGDLLAAVMGTAADPERPYHVPFSPLRSERKDARAGMAAPHLEIVLGMGEDAEGGRPAAAGALARRLVELREEGQIARWDDVALLFRASTGFPAYESAFEAAGIPFVTVAGQGFYNRPEIRDVLNLLRALAEPWDDLAMAGLLRSPAFGLSDAALYRLRWLEKDAQPYWSGMRGDLSSLEPADASRARRAWAILNELRPLVNRLPVAELLKRLVDRVDYRAILASADEEGSAGRLWRNLDKLLADAHSSGVTGVRAFLEHLDTLRDVGAREGEAPAEALGAVRLMTIHKSKGLEFPVVILADAARSPRGGGSAAFLLPRTGLTFKPDRLETAPLLHRLAKRQDDEEGEAEEKRLIYVALTRAQEKLILSGHIVQGARGPRVDGWLKDFLAAAGVDAATLLDRGGEPLVTSGASGESLRVWLSLVDGARDRQANGSREAPWPETDTLPLYRSLVLPEPDTDAAEPGEMLHPWRATGDRLRPPGEALGSLVHLALKNWLFPGDPTLAAFLEPAAIDLGLAEPAQRVEGIRLAETLLARFRAHPLWETISGVSERYHEVPYTYFVDPQRLDTGYIDLLYRVEERWYVVDFKTDSIGSRSEREAVVERYRPQMRRYAQAVRALLHEPARVQLCFLDDEGQVSVQEIK